MRRSAQSVGHSQVLTVPQCRVTRQHIVVRLQLQTITFDKLPLTSPLLHPMVARAILGVDDRERLLPGAADSACKVSAGPPTRSTW